MEFNESNIRPWGYYKVLSDEKSHKVKRIVVNNNKRLSLQKHLKRNEHWYIISGIGLMTLNKKEFEIKSGDSINIPIENEHRVKCLSDEPLIFIEVQTGSYFGEDDIIRLEDDFGR